MEKHSNRSAIVHLTKVSNYYYFLLSLASKMDFSALAIGQILNDLIVSIPLIKFAWQFAWLLSPHFEEESKQLH